MSLFLEVKSQRTEYNKEKTVCLSYLDLFVSLSQFKALISAGLSSSLFFLPSSLFLLAFKVSMFLDTSVGFLGPLARLGDTGVLQDQDT